VRTFLRLIHIDIIKREKMDRGLTDLSMRMRMRREEMHTDCPWGNLNIGHFEKRE
jgi:hypothetical protein